MYLNIDNELTQRRSQRAVSAKNTSNLHLRPHRSQVHDHDPNLTVKLKPYNQYTSPIVGAAYNIEAAKNQEEKTADNSLLSK